MSEPRGTPGDAGFSAVAAARTLHEDLKVAHWILVTSAREGQVRAVEAEMLIRSLWVTLHPGAGAVVPLYDLAHAQLMPAAHAVNVALLTMAVAEQLGHDAAETRALGLAALLKDIGEPLVPSEILAKPEPLDADELALLRKHPVEGARMLIETEESLELPAVVAYEHHLGPDGGGYPPLRFPRPAHFASRLIRLADVFCALAVRRPHRAARDVDAILAHVTERAGVEFDTTLVPRFVDAIEVLRDRLHVMQRADEPLPWAETEDAGAQD